MTGFRATRQSKEGRIGVILTAVLCGGFLYFWFRPATTKSVSWEQQTIPQIVTRALAEAAPQAEVEKWVLDLDLLEVAVLQAHLDMSSEAMETVQHIRQPDIHARAVRHLAQLFLTNDPKDYSAVFKIAEAVPDDARRAAIEESIAEQLTMLGYADVVLPNAKTPLQRSRIARIMAGTDGLEQAREMLPALRAAVTTLPSAESALLLTDIAGITVNLSLIDGPDAAIAAINMLPAESRNELWLELFRTCFGRGQNAAAEARTVLAAVPDESLRSRMELESLQSLIMLRPASELMGKFQEQVAVAPDLESKFAALINLSRVHERTRQPAESATALHAARAIAAKTSDPATRCRQMLELTTAFADAVLLDESMASLRAAHTAAASTQPESAKLPLLISVARFSHMQAQPERAITATNAAWELAQSLTIDATTTGDLGELLMRRGQWSEALTLAQKLPDTGERHDLLQSLAQFVTEDALGYSSIEFSPRGKNIDAIRAASGNDESRAAAMAEKEPSGFLRSRAWLAYAKGLAGPPVVFDATPIEPDAEIPEIPQKILEAEGTK